MKNLSVIHMNKYYCNSCERYLDFVIKRREAFDHAFGVDYLNSRYCPFCQSEDIEEVTIDESFCEKNY